jgi:4-amino-4-deoxy-L-arabinose transferase-like glycosyltransferase
MKPPAGSLWIGLAIGVASLWLYAWRLGEAPIYLSPDEAIISVDAHALASTGRDVHGTLLPLYFKVQLPGEERMGWFTPAIFYLSAIVQRIFRFSESAVRLPSVLVGVADVILIYFIGRRLFQQPFLPVVAALMLALTPAHFILSRYALDYLYPLPFVLAWLLLLLTFLERERPALLMAATFSLGIGFFSYIAAVVMMPLYFLLTCVAVVNRRGALRLLAVAAAGFALPLLVLIPWLVAHPTALADTVARYNLYDTKQLNALQGVRAFLSYPNLERLASTYWSFFNPSFLFFSGDRQMMFSTRSVGVFLFPIAILLPLGIFHALVSKRRGAWLVLIGFVTAPAAALLGGEEGVIIRAAELLPFTILLAAFGVEYLWSAAVVERPRALLLPAGAAALVATLAYASWMAVTAGRLGGSTPALLTVAAGMLAVGALPDGRQTGRVAACCILALVPLQFVSFSRDYFGDYRLRSSGWLGGNLRGALERLIALDERGGVPRVYFSTLQSTGGLADIRNRWMGSYWQFYLIKHHREELLQRTARFDPQQLTAVPTGSLILGNVEDRTTSALVGSGQLRQIDVVPEVNGAAFFTILQR